MNLPQLNNGLSWNTSQLYSSGIITAVPEPTALPLVALGGATLMRRRRRFGFGAIKLTGTPST